MSSYRTYTWRVNAKPPDNYHSLRHQNGHGYITQEAVSKFVTEHPEVENSSGQSKRYSLKLITGDNEGKPCTLSFWYWLKTICKTIKSPLQFRADGSLLFMYEYDFYELMNACREWMKWRELEWKRLYSHIGVLDHGWWSHGLRLIARLQWWVIAGTDNWSNPKFNPDKSRRMSSFRTKKRKLSELKPITSTRIGRNGAGDDDVDENELIRPVGVVIREPIVFNTHTHSESQSELVVLDKAESIMNDIDQTRAVRRQVEAFEDTMRAEEREKNVNLHVGVDIVPLMDVHPFTNYKTPRSTAQVLDAIDALFGEMSRAEYEKGIHCGLESYYEPKPGGRHGYKPIHIFNKKWGWQRLGTIDHIIPQSYGVFEHPRFYIMCHTRLNSHMGDKHPEYRIAAGLSRSQLTRIKSWIKRFKKMPELKDVWAKFCRELEDIVPVRQM